MKVWDYYKNIFVPANVAVSALRQAGMPISMDRLYEVERILTKKLDERVKKIETDAAKRGIGLKFTGKYTIPAKPLAEYLYSSKGLGLEVKEFTEKRGEPSTSKDALRHYAHIEIHHEDDSEEVLDILKARSYAKALSTYVHPFAHAVRSDGAIHPQYNWAQVRTARISAENPPVHQIPERSDSEVANLIKSFLVPRVKPARNLEEWDPKKHGTCLRWDIAGAEAAIRAAMLTKLFCSKPEVLWEYIRLGKDAHGRTASMIYNVPEGTYKKGTRERDVVGKNIFFAKLFLGSWRTIQQTLANKARMFLSESQAKEWDERFDKGYPVLGELGEYDKWYLAKHGYVQDGYGRRRAIEIPPGVKYSESGRHKVKWFTRDAPQGAFKKLQEAFHTAANSPTQSMNATDNFWMIALCYHGEYMELRVPPMWDKLGVPFPEAKNWRMHEGPGPGGKPFQAWHNNTVHDSGWADCAPGYLEPTAKLIFRRCHSLPFDWRLKSDVPYRIDLKVGPNQADMMDYNKAAKRFNLEPLPFDQY